MRRVLRIGVVAPIVERVPPRRYGGTERIVHLLTEALVSRGHQVTLFASGDSLTSARLVPAVEHAIWHDPEFRGEAGWPMVAQLGRLAAMQHEFDIIHNHADYMFFPLLAGLEVASLTTLHGRLDQPAYRQMLSQYPFAPLVSISDAQREHSEDLNLNWMGTVHHGLDPSHFTFSPGEGSYLLFLGRMSPEKGPDTAIRVALEAGLKIRLAAKVPEEDQDYFDSAVRPLLGHADVEYIGEVDDAEKRELLAGASALLHPADWPEPFGLALIEAMASGTPVVALGRGAIPEIVEDGRTGFVCGSANEMVLACRRLREVSRADCRERFLRLFSLETMTEGYLRVYERALEAGPQRVP